MAAVQETNELKLSFNDMKEKKMFTDIVINCADGQLEAHRMVLVAKSSYFQTMFLSPFKESTSGQIDFSHIHKDIMELIMHYFYSDSIGNVSELSYSKLIVLFQTSDLFQLESLRRHFWRLIMRTISVDNWLDAWNIVTLHGSDSDIRRVFRFIVKNASKVVESEEFKSLNISQVLSLVGKINQYKPPIKECLLQGFIRWSHVHGDNKPLEELFPSINFDFISKEFMKSVIQSEEGLFKDRFFKECFEKQIFPRLKPRSEVEKLISAQKVNFSELHLKFFYFGCYKRKVNNHYVYAKEGLRIFDVETQSLNFIGNLPFHLGDGIIPVQHNSDIYIIGGDLKNTPDRQNMSNLTQTFFRYDWKTNRISELPPPPKVVSLNCHVCVVKDDIYVVQDDCLIENVFQYFSIIKGKWFEIECSLLPVKICANIKDVLYLLCVNVDNTLSFYRVNNYICNFYCNLSVENFEVISDFCVLGSILIVINENLRYRFKTETKDVQIENINKKHDYFIMIPYEFYPVNGLLYYDKMFHRLFVTYVNYIQISGFLEVNRHFENYCFNKYEKMLVYID